MLKKQAVLFIFFIGIMAGAGDVKGAEKHNMSSQPLPALEEIKPVPEIGEIAPVPEIKETAPPSEIKGTKTDTESDGASSDQNKNKKKEFRGLFGTLDRIGEQDVVINDNLCNLSSSIQYYSKNGKEISKSSFKDGERVGFMMNPADSYEVMSIWKIK
ncbi:MAG: hypothetical protein BWK80_39075 [Desulfobacteraceae bacterium IS3]|nr:MAG: hypothetical protein BWK80_39075 [Desulfobacteraceae bacterium IS3]